MRISNLKLYSDALRPRSFFYELLANAFVLSLDNHIFSDIWRDLFAIFQSVPKFCDVHFQKLKNLLPTLFDEFFLSFQKSVFVQTSDWKIRTVSSSCFYYSRISDRTGSYSLYIQLLYGIQRFSKWLKIIILPYVPLKRILRHAFCELLLAFPESSMCTLHRPVHPQFLSRILPTCWIELYVNLGDVN